MEKDSSYKVTVYYHHTDCGGVVYYARYLEFMEEARTAFFNEHGMPFNELVRNGTLFVVARQEIDYKYPAVYADILEVKSRVGAVSGVRIEFIHEIVNQNGKLIVKAKTTMVCVDTNLRPQALPEDVQHKLGQL